MKINCKLKKIFIFIMIGLSLNFFVLEVNAKENLIDASIISNTKDLVVGQKIDLTLRLNLKHKNDGDINAYKAKIVYDRNVFEKIKTGDIISLNGWEKLQFNEETGEFVAINIKGVNNASDVVRINLYVKSNTELKTTSIRFDDIVASSGKRDLFAKQESIDFFIKDKLLDNSSSSNELENFLDGNYSFVNNKTKENASSNTTVSVNKDSESIGNFDSKNINSDEFMEKKDNLGSSQNDKKIEVNKNYYLIYLLIIIIICLLLWILYKKCKSKDKNVSKKIFLLLLSGVLSLHVFMSVEAAIYDFSNKGELNDDGYIDYQDVELLQNHLINKFKLAEKFLDNADINNDENITVTDLSLLIRKIENTLMYDVEMFEVPGENKYVEKNKDFILKFGVVASYGAKVESVLINDAYYNVVADDKLENTYDVKMQSLSVSGLMEYKFTEVVLNNGKKIKVNYAKTIEILKEKPEITNYIVQEDIFNSAMKVSYDLVDRDNALLSSEVQIVDENDKVIKKSQIRKGHNLINLEVEDLEKYKVTFILRYNLTDDKNLEDENLVGSIYIEKELQLIIDYNFIISDFKFYNEDNTETSVFSKNDRIKLFFTSKNATKYIPKTLKVNGKNYEVGIDDKGYFVDILGFTKSGNNTVDVENVVLDNGKSFELSERLEVTVLKTEPVVRNIEITENNNDDDVKIDFEIYDEEKSLSKLVVNLENEKGELLDQISLTDEEIKSAGKISKSFKRYFADKYLVSVVATYSLADGSSNVLQDVILAKKEIEASAKAEITEATSNKHYYEKEENVLLNYKIDTNKNDLITAIVVNGKEYEAKKLENSEYQISYKLDSESGVKKLETTKLIYSNKMESSVNNSIEVEVLKDIPKVTEFKKNFDSDESKLNVNFIVEDKDNSFIESEVVLLNKNGMVVSSKAVSKGENKILFDIEAFELYTLKVNVTYDRDKVKDNVNRVDRENLLTEEISEELDKVVISKISTLENSENTKYFQKNKSIMISFQLKNNNLNIVEATVNDKKYSVIKSGVNYLVLVDGYSESGEKSLTIEKLQLSNSVELAVEGNTSAKIEVLKSKPEISNYTVEENINDSTLDISFDLADRDNAVYDAVLKIIDDHSEIVKIYKINRGANNLDLSVTEGKDYKARFELKYNLSLDEKTTDDSIVGVMNLEKQLRLNIDYNFVADNFKIFNFDDKETTVFGKNQKIKIMFESSNITLNYPDKIRINGKDWNIEREGNNFSATIDGFDKFGSNEINIEKITLSNGKSFEIKETLGVVVVKNLPTINDLSVVDKGERVRVDFQITDEDKALLELQITLFNDKDEIVGQEMLSSDELKMDSVTKLFNGVYTSTYKAVVTAGYLLTNDVSDKYEQVILAEKEVEATAKVKILSIESDKKYYEKGSDILLTYHIETNKTDSITSITIDDKNYVATKLDESRYQIVYSAFSSCGVKSLKTTNVTFSNTQVARVDNTLKIEVLKDVANITNFKQVDNINDSKITLSFNVNDSDDSFISGVAVLTNRNDKTKVEKTIKKGSNSLEFNVKELELYDFVIKATYDRDSNSLTDNKDNLVTDVLLLNREVQLVFDYDLDVSDLATFKDDVSTKYFAKNEEISLAFKSSNKTNFEVIEATINGKKYSVTKNNDGYFVKLNGYSTSGVKKLTIEKIKLSNTKEFNIAKNNSVQLEVLKSTPSIKDFSYEEDVYGDITIKFNLFDEESAVSKGKVQIVDEAGAITEENLKNDKNIIKFTPKENTNYVIKVLVNYDLDVNMIDGNSNSYENVVLLENEITLGSRQLQIKDIVSSEVYMQTEEGIIEAANFNVTDLNNLDNFIVKVKTRDMATFYTIIDEYRIDDNKLKLILKYDDVVQYNGSKKQNKLEIEYGKVKNGTVENTSLDLLIRKMEANPSGDFELTQDYDASFVSGNAISAVSKKFTGTLNGNGHKITNLTKPFFNELEGATIKNIVFSNVKLSGSNSHGTIANVATNTTVTNVHIKGLNYTTGADHSAGMIGEGTNTNIEKSSVTGFVITTSGHVRVSAMIGKLTGGIIKNCYVQGKINSTQTKDGNGIGGLLGHGFGVEAIENCISKITIVNNQGARLNGAVVGLFMNNSSVLKNNVSLSEGQNFYSVYGNGSKATLANNYELKDSGLNSNAAEGKVTIVSEEDINSNFYKNKAKFDDTIWDLSDTSFDKLPVLKNDDPNSVEDESDSESIYIPDYNRIKKVAGYKKSKEILYHNIFKLMPFYDAKYLIEDATKIASDDVLATKLIKHILPFSNGKLLTYFTSENYNTITDIKVVFDDFKIRSYKVNFKELKQNISIYQLEELGIDYAPNNYVIRSDSAIVETLKSYIEGLDYTTVLDPLTAAADARHYKDNYNENMKTSALNIALQLLQNDDENVLTINNEVLNKKIKEQLIDSGKINELIYAYNYYNKWYNFEIGGAKITDILLFENEMFKDKNNFENLINEVFVGNLAVGSTDSFFKSNVAKYTGSSELKYFLDYIITNIGGYEDVNDWFTEYFGSRNFLAEFGVDDRPELLYRGWYQLKKTSRMILPVINMPNGSTYMISGPAHLQFGPAQLYNKDTTSEAGKKVVRNVINNHVTLAKRHFTVLAGGFGSLKWNNYCIMCYDCTKIITGYKQGSITVGGITIPTGKTVPVYTQGRVGSNYAFFKNFSEVLGLWQPAGSSGGVGNTAGFLWFQAQPGLTNYDTWTHEFEHALFDKIMLDQRGFRTKLEDMTQGNVEQRDDWSINNLNQDVGPYYFNTSFYLDKEGNATQNLSPDRIDTKEEMENYFKGQQNALDLLDYIEGKAFIKLTPEQQAKIATRITSSAGRSAWGNVTAEQVTQMNLTSLESLYDNRIILRPPNAWGASVRGLVMPDFTVADNYGYESVWVNRWYIDHYDGGYSGAFAIKRNFFEMLGYAGVEGYIIYGSRRSSSDLDAIRKITELVTGTAMDWRQYKMSRYATVEENLNSNKYIDAEYMIQRFTEALINDANNGDRNVSQRTNLRKIYYHYLKSVTNDFIDDPLGSTVEVKHIKTAEELVEKINAQPYGYYVLDNDIDFSSMGTNVTKTFMGRLDGNGHKIIGNKLPVFNKIRYGYVGNIVFENTDIPKTISNAGALSYRAEMSTVEKISVKNLQMNFAGRNDLSLIGGAISNVVTRDCNVEKLTHHISSADDFAILNEDTGGIFIIDNDIDFTGKTYNGAVVTNVFTGKIDGNGHTLSNLTNASLFNSFRGTVENLNIKDFNNTSAGRGNGDFVTAFTQESFTATFRNMKFENITLSGRNNVAVVSGADARDNANSVFEKISVKNANVTGTGVYVSTFVGRKYGGRISNVFVQGKLIINSTENGGLVGSLQQNGTVVENVVTNVSITKTHNTYGNASLAEINGSMFGNIYNTPIIRNSIAFGTMKGYMSTSGSEFIPFKFTGASESQIIATMTNCYEVDEELGSTRVNANTQGKLNSVAQSNLNKVFYQNLGFDETLWNLDNLSSKGYPTLK